MSHLDRFIASPLFQFCLLPIIGAILALVLKRLSRPRNPINKERGVENLAIGFDLMVSSFFAVAVLHCNYAAELVTLHSMPISAAATHRAVTLATRLDKTPILIPLLLLIPVGIGLIQMEWGWDSSDRMKWWMVLVQDTLGLASLMAVVAAGVYAS